MRLRERHTLLFLNSIPSNLTLPVDFSEDSFSFNAESIEGDKEKLDSTVEGPINPSKLELRSGPEPLGGGTPEIGLYAPESMLLSHFLSRMVSLLSFLTDAPIRSAHKLASDTLLSESADDEQLLAAFPTSKVFQYIGIRASLRTFSPATLDSNALGELLNKETGLAIYLQALGMQDPLGAYREYWKLLESAFALQDKNLVDQLREYLPAEQIGFSEDELTKMLILRGRASHAQSREGMKEYRYVRAETLERLPRLKCLAEQVLLTKKTWGVPTQEVRRLVNINGYVDSKGNPVLIKL